MGLLAEKYHKLPSELVKLDLSPIAEFMFNNMISARTDRWMKEQLEKQRGGESASVAEHVRREQAEWQKLRLAS